MNQEDLCESNEDVVSIEGIRLVQLLLDFLFELQQVP
jgi:hypothetical protein